VARFTAVVATAAVAVDLVTVGAAAVRSLFFVPVENGGVGSSRATGQRVSAGRLRPILAAAAKTGVDPAALVSAAGLGAEVLQTGSSEIDITLGEYLKVWELAVRRSGCVDFPIRAATALSPDSFGVVGFSCMLSATIGDAFARLSRYYGILISTASWSLEAVGDRLRIVFELGDGDSLGARSAVEFALAEQVYFTRLLAAGPVQVIEASFPHPAPADDGSYRELFRCPLHWNAARATLLVDSALFDLPHSKSEPHLLAYFERQADALIAQRGAVEDTSARVRRLLVQALADGPPSAEAVARRLGVSTRSLRRRLADEGKSFYQLLEDTRSALAQQYLHDDKLTVGEIAFLVGFSDLRPFQRAFRRWTRQSPREYRNRLAASH
jgi:AraC-like DNA-binding protein